MEPTQPAAAVPRRAAPRTGGGSSSWAAVTWPSAGSRVLIAAGADVVVVSPQVTPALEGMAGEVTLVLRGVRAESDLDDDLVRHRGHRRPRRQRAGARRGRRAPDLLRPRRRRAARRPPGRRRRAGTARSPSRCSATASRGSRRRCATTSSRRCATAGSPTPAPASTRPGVVLVGGGPGDPELVTVAGRQALAEADVVVADRLAPRELLDELQRRRRADRRGQAAARPRRAAGARSTG